MNDTTLANAWAANATALKAKFNEVFWSPTDGMYRDNDTTTLCPQDANSMAVLYNLSTSASQASSVSDGLTKNWNELGAVAPELPDTISPFIGSLEVSSRLLLLVAKPLNLFDTQLQAHFEAGQDARAMDLLRREWGYMLYTNLSVQSTLLEGFTANGSLGYRSYRGYNYDPAYTSHAHGWSSGPTSALTFYVLGLSVTSPKGKIWSFAPHLSGLSGAEGGFETPLGWYGAKWALSKGTFIVQLSVPAGTTGVVVLPVQGKVVVDGKTVAQKDPAGKLELEGGQHTISVQTDHS